MRIEAPELCGRFTARVLRNVTIAPSSGAIKSFFDLLGQKQISNAVDASNFTLLGMGHPTHAFDLDKIEGGIVVRLAHKGERIKLLDGTERILEADDLVIADERKPLSLAGVMGGWDSMITPETKNILVESAWFDPASIRRSSRRHGLHTDASHRFERGADFDAAPVANALVSALILESGGESRRRPDRRRHPRDRGQDRLPPGHRPLRAIRPAPSRHHPRPRGHHQAAGRPVPHRARLHPALRSGYVDQAAVTLPSWRLDLEREIDLIEEVARVYGYNRFANTLPTPGIVIAQPTAAAEAAVKARLLALGYSEAISSTFASQADSDVFFDAATAPTAGTIAMENPLSEEATLLRPALVPGMVAMLSHNLNRDVRTVRLFEQGTVFTGSTSEVHEQASLSLGLTGAVAAAPLYAAADAPIFELKGVVESLLSLFDHPELRFAADAPAWLESGRGATAYLDGKVIARFGELSKSERERRKLRQPVFLAEIDLAALYALPLKKVTARELSRFQAVERDFSFTFPDTMLWATIAAALGQLRSPSSSASRPRRSSATPRARRFPPRHYALLLRCVFQSNERTLREEDLTAWSAQIIETLAALGGVLRA